MSPSSPYGQVVLRASSVSSRFLESLADCPDPVILGVHEQSLNLQCGEDVLVLAGSEAGNLPMGLLVDLPPGVTWKRTDLSPGARASVEERYLTLSPGLRIDLSPATIWPARRHLNTPFGTRETVRQTVLQTAGSLSEAAGLGRAAAHIEEILAGQSPAVDGEPYYVVGVDRLSDLVRALLSADASTLVQAAGELVGLGIGLTPSGDDVLVGFIGSLVLLADVIPTLVWVRQTAFEIVQSARGRTHPVSLTYLRCAVRQEIGELHEHLLKSLLAGNPQASIVACQGLRGFGHSSGSEIALGTLLGVQASAARFLPVR